jgi:hypothetical protein
MGAIAIAAVRNCQIHPVGGLWHLTEGGQDIQLKIVDWAGTIGLDQFIQMRLKAG